MAGEKIIMFRKIDPEKRKYWEGRIIEELEQIKRILGEINEHHDFLQDNLVTLLMTIDKDELAQQEEKLQQEEQEKLNKEQETINAKNISFRSGR